MAPLALLVDDEIGILETLSGVLSDHGYETVLTTSGEEAVEIYLARRPDVVFLDVWLPDRDGLETLALLREHDPQAAVVMLSGHGTTATAVRAMRMGAFDYLAKPPSSEQVVNAARGAVEARRAARALGPASLPPAPDRHAGGEPARTPPPRLRGLVAGALPQRTICHSTVLYGLGLHSGGRTGLVLQPLPPSSGIHFVSLPTGESIAAHASSVADTEYATTLSAHGAQVKTVEHLLSALHAAGVTNLLIKVHGEVPVLDGSALEFCRTLEEIGLEDQPAPRLEFVADRRYEVGSGDKSLVVEPFDGLAVSYLLRYPPPIGEQAFDFELTDFAAYRETIAPARTFGFMRDLKMM
ncbi:MAG: UDP-3-O-[3-hydroxymyristoyl] N-acetylglucosamine deacetylase, partial [Acidobacteria bacterium]|nr:UDP-3-O-[3-hydroxymyristoyl] N-acetylglucosamine deacetylase [Acidobacteriota bacterium]